MNYKKLIAIALYALLVMLLIYMVMQNFTTSLTIPLSSSTVSPTSEVDSLSYISDELRVNVSFPAEWAELIFISDWVSFDGFLLSDPAPQKCIALVPIGINGNNEISDTLIAAIYWRSVDDAGPESRSGECVIMAEIDNYQCVCWLPMSTKIGLEESSSEWVKYATVENGILNGEYEITLLD